MKHWVKKLLPIALLASALPLPAALQLRISDGTPAGTVVVQDQSPDDFNSEPGVVGYSGALGDKWSLTFSSGISKPAAGSAAAPYLDINTSDFSSVSDATLTVELTDTGFIGQGPAAIAIGGNTEGQVTYRTFLDASNVPFGMATPLSAQGPFDGNFGGNDTALVSSATPYSLTLQVVIEHPTPGRTGLDGDFSVAPPPGETNCVQQSDGGGRCANHTLGLLGLVTGLLQPILGHCGGDNGGHFLSLPGIATDLIFTASAGSFIVNANGTAQISGTAFSQCNSNQGFQVTLFLSGKTGVAPRGCPKKELQPCSYKENHGSIDSTKWHYYTGVVGTLIGLGEFDGAVLSITHSGAFQVGVGANNKNYKLGLSGSFNWSASHQPPGCAPLKPTGKGCVNMDMVDCPTTTASLCGMVVRDCDADGSLSGEAGLAGWTVALKSGHKVLATTTTDAGGNYCFNNLAPGCYTVCVARKPCYWQTADPDFWKDNAASITLADGQHKTGVKFGYTGTAASVDIVVQAPASAVCGETITYTFFATNTGNTCLYGGMKVESSVFCGEVFHASPVAPGEGFVFTKTYVVKPDDAGHLVNNVSVIGDPPGLLFLNRVLKCVTTTTTVTCTPSIPPNPPTCLTSVCGNASISLSWNISVGATAYILQRCTTLDGLFVTIAANITGTNYIDLDVLNGCVYYYKVCAVKDGLESLPCAILSAIPTCGLPSPWLLKDIGECLSLGGGSYSGGCYSLVGVGAAISGTLDGFSYACLPASGDCSIVARLTGLLNVGVSARAGVMIRESLTDGARHASMLITPHNGGLCTIRGTTYGASTDKECTGLLGTLLGPILDPLLAPCWVKVVRTGNVFKCYTSANGILWTLIESKTISMSTKVYIGLAVSSGNSGTHCPAIFDHVTAKP